MVISHDSNLNTYGLPLTKDNCDVMKFLILGRPKINLIYVLIIRIPPKKVKCPTPKQILPALASKNKGPEAREV